MLGTCGQWEANVQFRQRHGGPEPENQQNYFPNVQADHPGWKDQVQNTPVRFCNATPVSGRVEESKYSDGKFLTNNTVNYTEENSIRDDCRDSCWPEADASFYAYTGKDYSHSALPMQPKPRERDPPSRPRRVKEAFTGQHDHRNRGVLGEKMDEYFNHADDRANDRRDPHEDRGFGPSYGHRREIDRHFPQSGTYSRNPDSPSFEHTNSRDSNGRNCDGRPQNFRNEHELDKLQLTQKNNVKFSGCAESSQSTAASSSGTCEPQRKVNFGGMFVGELKKTSFRDRYEMGSKLGRGSFASVYIGRHISSGKDVAIKRIELTVPRSNRFCETTCWLAEQEARVLKMASASPHVTKILDAMQEGPVVYLVLERCRYSLLAAMRAQPVLDEFTLQRTLRGMLEAIEALHVLGIVHRDIKPDNFVCPNTEHVKLCDFGLAEIVTAKTPKLEPVDCGTPPFMSPELCQWKPHGTPVDIWSLGVCAYGLFFGHFPYGPQETNKLAMKKSIANNKSQPTFMPTSTLLKQGARPRKLAVQFCQKLLLRNPECRPTAKECLDHPWFAASAFVEEERYKLPCLRPTLESAHTSGFFSLHSIEV